MPHLTFSDFEPLLHTRFAVAGHGACELELVELADRSNAVLEQFSLTFQGAASPWLPQGVYLLLHPVLIECELFLVPSGPSHGGMRYEVSFARLIQDHP